VSAFFVSDKKINFFFIQPLKCNWRDSVLEKNREISYNPAGLRTTASTIIVGQQGLKLSSRGVCKLQGHEATIKTSAATQH
jgi:hypothetical protein